MINHRCTSSGTALYAAAVSGNTELCQLLVTQGADVELGYESGHTKITPLEAALQQKHDAVVSLLMGAGANPKRLYQSMAFGLIEKPLELMTMVDRGQVNIHEARDTQGYSLLYQAVFKRNKETCDFLLNYGANAQELLPQLNKTLLFVAIESNHVGICEALLNRGADPECYERRQKAKQGRSGLMLAVERRLFSVCQLLLLKATAPEKKKLILDYPNKASSNSETPLYIAAETGQVEMCSLLITHGANIELGYTASTGKTISPLEIAVQKGHNSVVQLLAQRGANQSNIHLHRAFYATSMGDGATFLNLLRAHPTMDVNAENGSRQTFLYLWSQKQRLDICEALLQRGADVNQVCYYPTHSRITLCEPGRVPDQSVRLSSEIYLEKNPDGSVNAHYFYNNATWQSQKLMIDFSQIGIAQNVAEWTRARDIQTLIAVLRASIRYTNYRDCCEPPLLLAVKLHNLDLCALLLNRGANADCRGTDWKGHVMTPLVYAVHKNLLPMAEVLLEGLQRQNKLSTVNTLEYYSNVCYCSAFSLAVTTKNVAMCTLFINKEVDPTVCNDPSQVNSPLAIAVSANTFPIVDLFLTFLKRAPQRFNLKAFVQHGKTVLHIAVEQGNLDMVKRLLDSGLGIDINAFAGGQTVLHLAAQKGYVQIIERLLNSGLGVDLNISNGNNGCTPLYVAAAAGQEAAVQLLVNRGADVRLGIKNQSGITTPLHIAAECGHAKVVAILEPVVRKLEKEDPSVQGKRFSFG